MEEGEVDPPRRWGHVESSAATVRQPSLIVLTGPPGAGKTTLAQRLASAVPCPLVSRDEIKEGLQVADASLGEDEASRIAYDAFFASVDLLLRRGVTVVAEAAFQHRRWAEPLTRLRELGRLRIVVCEVSRELALERRVERMREDPRRERFHPDSLVAAKREGQPVSLGTYDPPRLEVPTLRVDTSDGYVPSLEAIVAFARG